MADRPGNHRALEEILSATNPKVEERLDGFMVWWEERGYLYVRCMVSRRVAAYLRDDVCQDIAFVLMKAVRDGKYTYQEGKPFETFVSTITKREIIKTYKASGQQTSLVEMPQTLKDDSQDGSFSELDQHELFIVALDQLKTLPPRRREVLTLWFEHGLSLQEVSVKLGISYELARKEKSLALRELRQKMARDLGWTD
jgi:RNA polymerase sigma factor (sigma-70 family)